MINPATGTRMARGNSNRDLLRVEGMEDVLKNIAAVMDRTTAKHLKKVYFKAALIASDQARRNIDGLPVSPELKRVLKASVVTNEGPADKPNAISAVNQWAAMRRLGGKASGLRFPNPAWFEKGIASRQTKGGKPTGSIRETPFFRPAVITKMHEIRDFLVRELKDIITRADTAKAAGKSEARGVLHEMTAEEKVFAVLSASGDITALVPSGRIKVQSDLQGIDAPYMVHFPVGVETFRVHSGILSLRKWDSYQISVFSPDYAEARAIAGAIVTALDGYSDADVNRCNWIRTTPSAFDSDLGLAHIAVEFDLSGALS